MIDKIFYSFLCVIRKAYYKLFKRCMHFGKKTRFKKGCMFYADRCSRLFVGENVFFNRNCSVICRGEIIIGDNCLFGESVKIYDHNHIFNKKDKNINKCGLKIKPVSIGNNCWFGSNVVITAGSTIGDNCVIGAGVVIAGKIEPNTIVKFNNNSIIKQNIEFK